MNIGQCRERLEEVEKSCDRIGGFMETATHRTLLESITIGQKKEIKFLRDLLTILEEI